MKQFLSDLLGTGKKRNLTGWLKVVCSVLGIGLSLYQLWVAALSRLDPHLIRAIHLAFILPLLFLTHSFSRRRSLDRVPLIDLVLAAVSLTTGVYTLLNSERILSRWAMADVVTAGDFFFGLALIFLILEGTRRTVGFSFVCVVMCFLAYMFAGPLLPGLFYHGGISVERMVDAQFLAREGGIFGIPLGVAATYIFLFVLFGVFLDKAGASKFFYEFSLICAGRLRGGPAKIAIFASALFGMISGAPVANVVTTGAFTIPMMRRAGFMPHFAAAVEAVASTGGTIAPPIMGAVAFLMSEMTGIPYLKIAIAAAFPAFLYYLSLFMMIHFRALKRNLKPMQVDQMPRLGSVLRDGAQHLLPVGLIVGLLYWGYTPSLSAVWGIVAIVGMAALRGRTRMGPKKILEALEGGAKNAVVISAVCAGAGIITGSISTTGLAGKVSSLVVGLSGGMLLPALVLVMLICLLLGMGMTISASYILTAVLAVPAVIRLGVEPLPAHLFAVYFAGIAAITPPVALAAYAAAGIAEASPWKTGWTACRLGIVAFLVPYFFVYQPVLLLQSFSLETVWRVVLSIVGVIALAAGMMGYLLTVLTIAMRALAVVAGVALIFPHLVADLIGLALLALLLILQGLEWKRVQPRTVAEPSAAAAGFALAGKEALTTPEED